jgi:hypothetical protein
MIIEMANASKMAGQPVINISGIAGELLLFLVQFHDSVKYYLPHRP